jgi:hypothetical protein
MNFRSMDTIIILRVPPLLRCVRSRSWPWFHLTILREAKAKIVITIEMVAAFEASLRSSWAMGSWGRSN